MQIFLLSAQAREQACGCACMGVFLDFCDGGGGRSGCGGGRKKWELWDLWEFWEDGADEMARGFAERRIRLLVMATVADWAACDSGGGRSGCGGGRKKWDLWDLWDLWENGANEMDRGFAERRIRLLGWLRW